jgi:hypothetical protein
MASTDLPRCMRYCPALSVRSTPVTRQEPEGEGVLDEPARAQLGGDESTPRPAAPDHGRRLSGRKPTGRRDPRHEDERQEGEESRQVPR